MIDLGRPYDRAWEETAPTTDPSEKGKRFHLGNEKEGDRLSPAHDPVKEILIQLEWSLEHWDPLRTQAGHIDESFHLSYNLYYHNGGKNGLKNKTQEKVPPTGHLTCHITCHI
jgi:hypothetical protein